MRTRMRFAAALLALVVAFALLPSVAVAAAPIPQGIKGTVRDASTGLPIPFADIHIDYSAGGHIAYLTADWDGTYSIPLLPDDYYLEAYSSRFAYEEFDPVTVSAGAVTVRDFVLDEDTLPVQPVYRFFNMQAGVHFYTASDQEFLNVYQNLSGIFHYDGIAYRVPWGAGQDPDYVNRNTMPLYRFFNKRTGVHFYTMGEQEKNTVINTLGDRYTFEGVAFWVTDDLFEATPIHRYYVPLRDTHFFTADQGETIALRSGLSDYYHYEGVGFYVGDWRYVGAQGAEPQAAPSERHH